MKTATQNIPIVDSDLSVLDLAALHVAGRDFSKQRDQLAAGDHKVWGTYLITGGISVGDPVAARTSADYLGVLAWVLARLPERQRAAVAHAAACDGFSVTKAEREAARAVCEPTSGSTTRAGTVRGVLQVDRIRS